MSDPNPYNLTNLNSVWSSDWIVKARASYNNSLYQWQKTNGCNLILNVYNGNTIRLSAYTGTSTIIAFPEGPRTRIRTIYKQVSGAPNTKYYVYLTASDFFISTVPPTHKFSRLWVNSQYNGILVGWLAFADWNTLDGDWNVYSFYNEPQRSYSANIVSATTVLTKRGFIVPEGKTAYLTRSQQTCICSTCGGSLCVTLGSRSGSIGSCYIFYMCGGAVVCYGFTCGFVPFYCSGAYPLPVSVWATLEFTGDITDTIRNTFSLTHGLSGSCYFSSFAGQLTITRRA